MDRTVEVYFKDLAIEYLMKTPLGDKMQQGLHIFEIIQEHICALQEKQGEEEMTKTKMVTVLTFALLKKMTEGKNPKEFKTDEWKEIVSMVSHYAILQDNQLYTVFVFSAYESYIRASADYVETYASEATVTAIRLLADELRYKKNLLEAKEIAEVCYIEDCLWISLEAIIKLIASLSERVKDDRIAGFTNALAACAFEYGRFFVMKREQALVNQFIESQYILDQELKQKYSTFVDELKNRTEQFYILVDNAFAPDFRESFLYSIQLAQKTGVSADEILSTEADIDDFFMN